MDRRQFLAASTATAAAGRAAGGPDKALPGFASPVKARQAPREKFVFVACSYAGTDVWESDFLATVDVDPASRNYSKIVSRVAMPIVGDEIFRFGWNVCSSSHKTPSERRYMLLPGLRSGRINVVDVGEPERLWMHKSVEPTKILDETGCTVPYVVRPLPTGDIMVSTLGGQSYLDNRTLPKGPGLFLLDAEFRVKQRWDAPNAAGGSFGDFWYQVGIPRPVVVTSSWGMRAFDPKSILRNKGHESGWLQIWAWNDPSSTRGIELKPDGGGTLPVRFLHNPTEPQGYVAAVLGGTVWRFVDRNTFPVRPKEKSSPNYVAHKAIEVEPVEVGGKEIRPMTTDMVISINDRFLYIANWLHGDVRQYYIGEPDERKKPKLMAQIFLGGLLGKGITLKGKKLWGGPQSLQLSLDGDRLYVTK